MCSGGPHRQVVCPIHCAYTCNGAKKLTGSYVYSGVGFSVGVIASVIIFRRSYPLLFSHSCHAPVNCTKSTTAVQLIQLRRTWMANRARHWLRSGHGIRRLRPPVQPRADTRHTHHSCFGSGEVHDGAQQVVYAADGKEETGLSDIDSGFGHESGLPMQHTPLLVCSNHCARSLETETTHSALSCHA